MFERFTNEARRAVVVAQEEARSLQHNYIGTEHLLLALLAEPDSIAARAAARFGLTLDVARDDVVSLIGPGKKEPPRGHIPFTPRAKKILEFSLREALQVGDNFIGSEHLLLGILREGKGVAAQILVRHAENLDNVRVAVTDLLPPTRTGGRPRRWAREARLASSVRLQPDPAAELRTTPAADTSLAAAARLAGSGPVGSHHILLASLADTDSTAARTLAGLGLDLDQVRAALRTADVAGSTDELPEEAGRRQLTVTVSADRVTVEAADPAIVEAGRAAASALDSAVIRGDNPAAASLTQVWQALHDSLADILSRAGAA